MATISKHGREVRNVFSLLGQKENDLSASLGWALAQCPGFLSGFVQFLTGKKLSSSALADALVKLQSHDGTDRGYTDVELLIPDHLYAVIEMKKGWGLPGKAQLEKYAHRTGFDHSGYQHRMILSLSESTERFAAQFLPSTAGLQIPVSHLSWTQVMDIARKSITGSSNHEKRLLRDLLNYLATATTMRRIDSNWTLVVALSDDGMPGWDLTFRQVVAEKERYFHPVGHRWPHEPLNYIAFRSGGKIRSIHHIEEYTVTKDPNPLFPEANGGMFDVQHYIYKLGPAIVPSHEVRNGTRIHRNMRVWCMLDTLLTCSTITEAMEVSREREEKNK